jgi:hypothetical protein
LEREGTVNIAFVLSREQDSVPLWEPIAPVRTTGDRVEFWLPDLVSESRLSDLPLLAVLGNSPVSAFRAVTLSAGMAAFKWEAKKSSLPDGLASSVRTDPRPGGGTGPGAPSRFSREELSRSVAGIRIEYLQRWEGRER